MKERIGFIGLGIMGAPMAINLLRGGHPLVVYNRTPAKMQLLLGLGAARWSSPWFLIRRMWNRFTLGQKAC